MRLVMDSFPDRGGLADLGILASGDRPGYVTIEACTRWPDGQPVAVEIPVHVIPALLSILDAARIVATPPDILPLLERMAA